jgi:hypothetical protein
MGKSAAKGAILQVKNTTWQTVKYIGDFDFPMPPPQIEDATTHDSPNNQEEMIPTILKAPKIVIPIKWDDGDTVHQFLITSNGTVQSYSYQGTGHSSAFKFNAITEVTFKNPVKGIKESTLTLTVSDGNTPS